MERNLSLEELQQRLDLEQLQERFEVLRKSEFFPAIMGAVAGGLTGAIMAGLISSRRGADEAPTGKDRTGSSGVVLGFTAKDLLQLVTIVAQLARQMRGLREQ